jgi:ornithine lipid ester-linked acyl 2-hydroxylase
MTINNIKHLYSWPKNEKIVFLRPPKEEYHGNLKNFYHPKSFPELNILKKNWEAIRDEITDFENKTGDLKGMSSVNPANVYGGKWTLIYLKSFLRNFHKNRNRFPLTCSLIDKVPNCVFSAISILPPNTEIAPHYGDTNGIVRVHLGLIVPETYPTIAIRVGDEEVGWEEGEFMCFINVQKHSVWNRSNKKRYVLMLDIVPEELKNKKIDISTRGLGSQTYNYFYSKFSFYRKLPKPLLDLSIFIFTILWKIYLPIENKLKLA